MSTSQRLEESASGSILWPLEDRTRVNILGVGVSAIDMRGAIAASDRLLQDGGRGYICVTGVHGIMESQRDSSLRKIHNSSFLTLPDGMPTVWIGRLQRFCMERVYGPNFMMEFCLSTTARGYRHFLYGGKAGVADELKSALEGHVPGVQIVGTYSPPFRPLEDLEILSLKQTLNELKPSILWVGLSTPKQERFMSEFLPQLPVQLMVGVGAAFDIHTGRIKDAPGWVKTMGLQWSHRLAQDYRRLWRRYLIHHPRFVLMWCMQALGRARFSQEQEDGEV